MIDTTVISAAQLDSTVKAALGNYRRAIFIEKLGWPLPLVDGLEIDQFDRPDTIYVVGKTESGDICGCARLLPTTRPYLLGEVFPDLMGDAAPPCSAHVWEISRFSSSILSGGPDALRQAHRNTRILLAKIVRFAQAAGVKRLITVSPLAVERLLNRLKVHIHRAGPPRLIDGKPVFACWIEVDDITLQALDIEPAAASAAGPLRDS